MGVILLQFSYLELFQLVCFSSRFSFISSSLSRLLSCFMASRFFQPVESSKPTLCGSDSWRLISKRSLMLYLHAKRKKTQCKSAVQINQCRLVKITWDVPILLDQVNKLIQAIFRIVMYPRDSPGFSMFSGLGLGFRGSLGFSRVLVAIHKIA